jgi:hypothetical protein
MVIIPSSETVIFACCLENAEIVEHKVAQGGVFTKDVGGAFLKRDSGSGIRAGDDLK